MQPGFAAVRRRRCSLTWPTAFLCPPPSRPSWTRPPSCAWPSASSRSAKFWSNTSGQVSWGQVEQQQNPRLSRFLTLRSPHREQSSPRHHAGVLLLSLFLQKTNSGHFSSPSISVRQHCPSPLSVCIVCVCVCVCVCGVCVWLCVCVCVCVCGVCVCVCVCVRDAGMAVDTGLVELPGCRSPEQLQPVRT